MTWFDTFTLAAAGAYWVVRVQDFLIQRPRRRPTPTTWMIPAATWVDVDGNIRQIGDTP